MATDRQKQYIDPLYTLLRKIAVIDPNTLVQSERLGSELSFERIIPIFSAIASCSSRLAKLDLENVPYGVLSGLLSTFQQIDSVISQIISFSPVNHGNAAQARESFVQQLEDLWNAIYSTAQTTLSSNTEDLAKREIESLAIQVRTSVQMAAEAADSIKTKQAELSTDLEKFLEQKKTEFEIESTEKFANINVVLDSVRNAAAEAGVSQNSIYFSQEAGEHLSAARKWLEATILVAILLVAFGLWGTKLLAWTGTPEPLDAAAFIVQLRFFIQKGLVVFGLIFALILTTRNYSSARHNYVVNKHRNNALSSFQAFASSASDEQTKNAVLMQATQSIFAPQPSGYIKVDGENTAHGSVIEILRTVGGAKDKV